MTDDTLLPFDFPVVGRKKVVAAFNGGRITSDGGVMLLAGFERKLGIAKMLAALIPDRRNPLLVTHPFEDILRARMSTQRENVPCFCSTRMSPFGAPRSGS